MNRENKRKIFEKGYYKTHACNDTFTCKVCGRVCTPQNAGSDHRNHCPNCLSSLHVDEEPGDRASDCGGIMEPVAVWVRKGGAGKERFGRVGGGRGAVHFRPCVRPCAAACVRQPGCRLHQRCTERHLSTYLLPWFKMTTWYFRLSRLLEVSNVKKRTKNHSADADRIFMLVKNHVLAVSGMGDEAPSTPGGRNGGRDVPSLWTARAIWWESLYRGNLPEGKRSVPQAELLEQLYQKFNCAHPTDYHGHSLSVSDVIMLNQNGKILAHYVDSIGFKELPGFLDKKQERPSVLLNLKEKCDAPECNPIVCRKARAEHEL